MALESDDGDNFFCPFSDCQYDDRELFVLEDNTAAGDLQVTSIDLVQDTDSSLEITSGPTDDQSGPELATVTASFECSSTGNFLNRRQVAGSGWIEMDVTASDGNLKIQTTRRLAVECIPD